MKEWMSAIATAKLEFQSNQTFVDSPVTSDSADLSPGKDFFEDIASPSFDLDEDGDGWANATQINTEDDDPTSQDIAEVEE
jgi:hypothetical protein